MAKGLKLWSLIIIIVSLPLSNIKTTTEVMSFSFNQGAQSTTGNPQLHIIYAYASTNTHENAKQLTDFFKNLQEVICFIPCHRFILLIGHFNAKISNQNVRYVNTLDRQTRIGRVYYI